MTPEDIARLVGNLLGYVILVFLLFHFKKKGNEKAAKVVTVIFVLAVLSLLANIFV